MIDKAQNSPTKIEQTTREKTDKIRPEEKKEDLDEEKKKYQLTTIFRVFEAA